MPLIPDWATVAGIRARIRSLHRSLFQRDQVEREMGEEFAHHMAMRTDALIREGVPPAEAARQARMEFGHPANHRADAREARGLRPFDRIVVSWLDVKLAFRMLIKNPILSLAAVFALAVGIPVGLSPGHLARALKAPLPGDADNRVRAVRYWDPVTSGVSSTAHEEYEYWSRTLKSFSALGAFRTSTYNVGPIEGTAEPLPGAQITSSIFDVLQASPQLGRRLTVADAEAGAAPVVVLSHQVWASRFGSDPRIVGSAIRIGRTLTTVVGVMPQGFHFPSKEAVWLPLRVETFGDAGQSPPVRIVGRLADGMSAEQAQSEVSTAARPPLGDAGEAKRRLQLRPEVVPFGLLYLGLPRGGLDALPEFRYVQLLTLVLLLVACGNVAMLVYARTSTRLKEIAIRTALGASRTRIVAQIFVEALVMAMLAAGLGVVTVDWLLGHVNLAAIAGESALPYWLSLRVTGTTLTQALVLAAVSATVAGVIPALSITGRNIQQHMRGGSRTRFGALTTVLVVADVAVSVAAVGFALTIVDRSTDLREAELAAGIPAAEYLAVQFRLPDAAAAGAADARAGAGTSSTALPSVSPSALPSASSVALPSGASVQNGVAVRSAANRLSDTQRALVAALRAEPEVKGVAVGDALPRMEHRSQAVEVDNLQRPDDAAVRWVRTAQVDVEYFQALEQRVLTGRDFLRSDVEGGRPVVIVNSAFVEQRLGGRDPIGVRLRFPAPRGESTAQWHEIVGVVPHLGVNMLNPDNGAAVYVPAPAGTINPMLLGIHVGPSPERMIARVRAIAAAVDPDLVIGTVSALSDVRQGDWYLVVSIAAGLLLLVGVLVALATSGLYAMLSLTVSERTREIGIRSALGATPRSLVVTVLRRSLTQIALGGAIGVPIAGWTVYALTGGADAGSSLVGSMLMAVGMAAGIVLVVGVCSCLVPTRRVLAVEASEAMRADG